MDLKDFREPQSPWFFSQPPTFIVENRVNNVATLPRKMVEPAPDNRYPHYAAVMSDGRLATDYRPRCELNMPTGTQYAARQFMQKNADAIIEKSRARQAVAARAGLSFDSVTNVPSQFHMKCDTTECSLIPGDPAGHGVERNEATPPLFGTFSPSSPSWRGAEPLLTKTYEGGRNTPRGSTLY